MKSNYESLSHKSTPALKGRLSSETIAQAETHGCRMQRALTAEHLTDCFYKADVTHRVVLARQ